MIEENSNIVQIEFKECLKSVQKFTKHFYILYDFIYVLLIFSNLKSYLKFLTKN